MRPGRIWWGCWRRTLRGRAGPPADAIIKDCYWARTKDDSGQFNAIIANGNAQGPGSVTIKAGEFFQTSGGCTWTKQ